MPVEYRRALAEDEGDRGHDAAACAAAGALKKQSEVMGKVTGFLEIDRQDRRYKPASDRIRHYQASS